MYFINPYENAKNEIKELQRYYRELKKNTRNNHTADNLLQSKREDIARSLEVKEEEYYRLLDIELEKAYKGKYNQLESDIMELLRSNEKEIKNRFIEQWQYTRELFPEQPAKYFWDNEEAEIIDGFSDQELFTYVLDTIQLATRFEVLEEQTRAIGLFTIKGEQEDAEVTQLSLFEKFATEEASKEKALFTLEQNKRLLALSDNFIKKIADATRPDKKRRRTNKKEQQAAEELRKDITRVPDTNYTLTYKVNNNLIEWSYGDIRANPYIVYSKDFKTDKSGNVLNSKGQVIEGKDNEEIDEEVNINRWKSVNQNYVYAFVSIATEQAQRVLETGTEEKQITISVKDFLSKMGMRSDTPPSNIVNEIQNFSNFWAIFTDPFDKSYKMKPFMVFKGYESKTQTIDIELPAVMEVCKCIQENPNMRVKKGKKIIERKVHYMSQKTAFSINNAKGKYTRAMIEAFVKGESRCSAKATYHKKAIELMKETPFMWEEYEETPSKHKADFLKRNFQYFLDKINSNEVMINRKMPENKIENIPTPQTLERIIYEFPPLKEDKKQAKHNKKGS